MRMSKARSGGMPYTIISIPFACLLDRCAGAADLIDEFVDRFLHGAVEGFGDVDVETSTAGDFAVFALDAVADDDHRPGDAVGVDDAVPTTERPARGADRVQCLRDVVAVVGMFV